MRVDIKQNKKQNKIESLEKIASSCWKFFTLSFIKDLSTIWFTFYEIDEAKGVNKFRVEVKKCTALLFHLYK